MERLGPNSPRRIEAVVAGMVKTYNIPRRINEASLAPQPLFIAWLLYKLQAFGFELCDLLIEGFTLKVYDGARCFGQCLHSVN